MNNDQFNLTRETNFLEFDTVLYYNNILFIVLSPAAVLMLPMSRIMVSQKFTYPPGLRDPALRGNRLSSSINHSIHQGIDHQF